VNEERWFRWFVGSEKRPSIPGFFNEFQQFLSTSDTAAQPYRLNQRHRALIQSNQAIIRDRRVLDIASHDGRWSFAAHKAGAKYVLGIEARQHLVEFAGRNMRTYAVPLPAVEFIQGDVLEKLDALKEGSFDTVFCFGFLYHTIEHMLLLRKIARIQPSSLIVDTAVSTFPESIVEVHDESIAHESAGAVGDPGSPERVVVGLPSKPALELMLRGAGFRVAQYYDWRNADIRWGDDLKDYYLGTRVSVVAIADRGSS
jgi:hypothetical protein